MSRTRRVAVRLHKRGLDPRAVIPQHAGAPPDPWPPPQPEFVRALYDEAGFVKRDFFRLLGERTNWTRVPFTTSRVRVETPCRKQICVLGDSICKEIGKRVEKTLGRKCLGILDDRIGQLTSSRLEKTMLHSANGDNCKAYILCGISLHWMVSRQSAENGHNIRIFHDKIAPLSDPVQDHALYVKALLHNLSAFAVSQPRPREVAKPIILVGSGQLDALTILSHPAKRDWRDFHQFALLGMWRNAERQIFSRRITPEEEDAAAARSPGHNASSMYHNASSLRLPSATSVKLPPMWAARGITYLDTHEIYSRYPGVRCDGMHFASDFATFDGGLASTRPHACHGSPALWDWYLLNALEAAGLYDQIAPDHWRERASLLQPREP